jgi:nicotinamidase/pyrazinamidase
LDVREVVLYGVATDYCVKHSALGMRENGVDVYLVLDAIEPVTQQGGREALDDMLKAGVRPVLARDVIC